MLLKPVVIIAIVAVVMIGMMVPGVFADHSEITITPTFGSGSGSGCEITKQGCYSPNTATVEIGDVVIFLNTDNLLHTFTSGFPSDDVVGTEFNSGVLDTGDSFTWKPKHVGKFPYFDMTHPWMIGTIIVQETVVEEKTPSEVAAHNACIDDIDTNWKISFTFEMVMDGQKAEVQPNIGIRDECQRAIYTLSNDGTVYAEWIENPDFELGHFLYISKFPIRDMEESKTEVYVNGRLVEDGLKTPLQDKYHYKTVFTTKNYDTSNETINETIVKEETHSEVVEKSKFKKYSNYKYNFSFIYPSEFDSHFKGVDSTPMIWKNDPHPELPWFKVWKTVKTIPEGIFATTYEFKVYSDNEMSEYSQSELLDLLENSSINLFTDMCSPENCTVTKTDSNISTNGNGAKILDIIVQTVTNYEKGVTQYITNSMRITMLNANNDILTIQHTTSSNDNFTYLFYEPHFTHMVKSLETQYIPKDSLKNTSTIFTAYGETVVTPEGGGGCLIATATYGSEMAPQVQQLRELRDNQLLQTESGKQFMGMFNDIYYSFSPYIADMERESPLFKEAVKLAITPMISSLSLMENANSESEVLGYGISLILLNFGMYLGVPAVVIVGIRKRF
jgi:plastocyanin